MKSSLSDFQFQNWPEKIEFYRSDPGIWYSSEIKRWMVTKPSLIREIMNNRTFVVPTYKSGMLGPRLGIDFSILDQLTDYIPLAFEGDRHKKLRTEFARLIAQNTPQALSTFNMSLNENLNTNLKNETFCLIENILKPSLRATLKALTGLHIPESTSVEIIPQLFDFSISRKRRLAIQNAISELLNSSNLPPEETRYAIALLAVSLNTLLGSIARSCIFQIQSSFSIPLSNIKWNDDFSHTALPLVEKVASRDTTVENSKIKSGDRLRLFIDAAGYENEQNNPEYSDLYFAIGIHRCVGMSLSRQIWKILTSRLGSEKATFKILNVEYRKGDNLFIFPTACQIRII